MGGLEVEALVTSRDIASDLPTRYFLDEKIKSVINEFYGGDYIHQSHNIEEPNVEFSRYCIVAEIKDAQTGELQKYEYDLEEIEFI